MTSPSEALNLTRKTGFCLIALNLQLPGIGMLEMVRIIRISQQTPILALTEPLEPVKIAALFRAGVDAFLEKPIKAEICAAQAESLMWLLLWANEGTDERNAVSAFLSMVCAPAMMYVHLCFLHF